MLQEEKSSWINSGFLAINKENRPVKENVITILVKRNKRKLGQIKAPKCS